MEQSAEVRSWYPPTPEQIAATPKDYLHIAAIITQCNFLHGKVLTIVDASYSNPAQNKAVKDLVRAVFREQMDHMIELSLDPQEGRTFNKQGTTRGPKK